MKVLHPKARKDGFPSVEKTHRVSLSLTHEKQTLTFLKVWIKKKMKLCFLTAVKSQICQITSSVLFKQSRLRQRCSPCGWVCRIPCGRCGSSTSGILGTRRAPGCTAGPWSQGGRSRSRLRSPHGSSSPWRDKDRLQMLPCRGAQSHVETISRFNWSELFHPPSQHDHLLLRRSHGVQVMISWRKQEALTPRTPVYPDHDDDDVGLVLSSDEERLNVW